MTIIIVLACRVLPSLQVVHVTSLVTCYPSCVKKAAYVYCYCISSLWERLVAPSDARIVSRKEAA